MLIIFHANLAPTLIEGLSSVVGHPVMAGQLNRLFSCSVNDSNQAIQWSNCQVA